MTSPYLQNWQNGRQIMEMIYVGDHGPNVPSVMAIV